MATRADTINQSTTLLMGLIEGFANAQITQQAKQQTAEREAQWKAMNFITEEAIKQGSPEAILGIMDSLKKIGYKPDQIDGFVNLATQRQQVMAMEKQHTEQIVNAAIGEGQTRFDQAVAGFGGLTKTAGPAPTEAVTPRGGVPQAPPGIAQAATMAGIQIPGQPPMADASGMVAGGAASGQRGAPLAAQPPFAMHAPPGAPPAPPAPQPAPQALAPTQPTLPEPATMPDTPPPQRFPWEAEEPGAVGLPPSAPVEPPPTRPTAPATLGGETAPTLETGRIGSGVGPQLLDDDRVTSYFRDKVLPTLKGLQPGTNLSLKVNDKVTLSINGNETAQSKARKLLSVGEKVGVSPSAMATMLLESGLPVDEKALDTYAQTLTNKTFKALLPEFAAAVGGKTSDRAVQQAAAFETFQRTGYLNPNFKDFTFESKEDAQRESLRLVNEQLAAGKSVQEVLQNAKLMKYPMTQDDEVGMLKGEYGKAFKDAIERQLTPEQAAQLAGAAVNFDPRVISDERLKMAFPVPPTEGIAGQAYAQGAGIRPSPEAVRQAQTAVTGREVEADRLKAQQRSDIELGQRREIVRPGSATASGPTPGRPAQPGAAGAPGPSLQQAEAEAAKRGTMSVPERLSNQQQEGITALRDVNSTAREVKRLFDPNYTGLTKGKATDLWERLDGLSGEESEFRAWSQRLLNDIIRAKAGLSQTATETVRAEMEQAVKGLPPSAFVARMEAEIKSLHNRAQNLVKNAKEQNLQAPEIEDIGNFTFKPTGAERFGKLKARGLPDDEVYRMIADEVRRGITTR